MALKTKTAQHAQRRAVRRAPFCATAEVTDLVSGTRLSVRTSELSVGGCYVDALNPFPKGTTVTVRIVRDQGVFQTSATVAYCDQSFGMGLAFKEMTPDNRLLLETWLAEIVTQLRPNS
jgi:PilZ domain